MYRFLTSIFKVFFLILASFWHQKIVKKSQLFEKSEVRRPPLKQYRFRGAFWMDFQALGARFRLIFMPPEITFGLPDRIWINMRGTFQVAELALMIRATRGRSIEKT